MNNISPHLLIDAVILSAALTITLVLRARSNAARKEKGNKWLHKEEEKEFKNPKLYKIWNLIIYVSELAIRVFLVYLYYAYVFIKNDAHLRHSDYLWGSESFIAWWVCILYF